MALRFVEIGVFFNVFTILTICLLAAVLLICKSLYDRRRIFEFARNFKGPTFYPIVGNGYHIIGINIFTALQTITGKFGTPCNVWFGHDYNYLTSDPDEIKMLLNNPNSFDKNSIYDSFRIGFQDTILLAPIDVWKKHRKFYAKSFSQPILNTFVQYFYNKSEILLDLLKESEHKDKFEMFEKYTLDSFCASVFGADYNLQTKPTWPLVEIFGELQHLLGNRLTSYYYYSEKIWFKLPEGRRAIKRYGDLRKIIYQIIDEKRKAMNENEIESPTDNMLPLFDSIVKVGNEYSDELIFREIFLFSAAATDTSGYSLAYTFTLLGMNPDIQEKVYQEIISTVGHDRPIYHDDLPNLKYTERAILEAMRILPVTPILGRLATGDVDLGSKVLPKGSNVLICVFNLHRNEKYWPDPLKYDPDRFLPEAVASRHPYTFIPFSAGPRNCIGKTYAMMLIKTCVANVVRNYEAFSNYKCVTELKLASCITMKTVDKLDCRFKLRKHRNV